MSWSTARNRLASTSTCWCYCWLLLQWVWQAATALLSGVYHFPAVMPGQDCALRNEGDTLPYQVNFSLGLHYRYQRESKSFREVPKQNSPFLFQKEIVHPEVIPNPSEKNPTMYLEKFGKLARLESSGVDQSLSVRHLILFFNDINTFPSKIPAVSF